MPCPVVTASISAWSSEGGSVSVQARHHRLRVMAGVSQERTARNGLGQQGRWGWWGWAGPPLWPLVGARVRRGGFQGSGWGEPLVPAEGEGAADQGLVAADGAVRADLEVGPAEFVLDLFVALLDPWPQAVEADDLGEFGRRVRAGGGVGCVGVGQVGGQVPGCLLRQAGRVGGGHDQSARGVRAVAGQVGVGGPPGLGVPVTEGRSTGVQSPGRLASFQDRAWAASMGVCGWSAGAQVPRCGLRATT